MKQQQSTSLQQQPPLWKSFVRGGLGSTIGVGSTQRSFNMVQMLQFYRHKIWSCQWCWYGISSQLLRASTYYTIKIGCYDVFKRKIFGEDAMFFQVKQRYYH